ncbi:CBS domain-containing protein [Herbidospora sp. NBRC 101105]|uniref:CBS domain-containing protein n=1 Tax=Herbidospora sp. NBRC 101105 TaxID=3032195 RepID=UPI0024A3E1EB|nr:CBS domain-containing protein [Herbidospora sp. NBRC 101105]GLX95516.1 hypothetical protein Hesp01_34660 [Herbidospora sp. NBRC 101105]
MTRVVVTVTPDESPIMAWELMRKGGMHHIAVVGPSRWPHGILSMQDIATGCSGTLADLSRRKVGDLIKSTLTPRVPLDRPLAGVAAVMLDSGRDAVPVVDEHCRAVGLITTVDVLRAVAGRISPGSGGSSDVHPALFRVEPVT